MKIGQGYDVHRFAQEVGHFEIRLGGVSIPHNQKILAHSDGDVVIHALCDALLGSLSLGDIGQHFPDSDAAYKDVDSQVLLREVYSKVLNEGYELGNADITIIAQSPRVAKYAVAMREILSRILSVDISLVSIKATTTEELGAMGRGEGIAALAIVLIEETLVKEARGHKGAHP
jgi:2-C-methyl-D-erythritol 2,4-cyclodiphosphate synthase